MGNEDTSIYTASARKAFIVRISGDEQKMLRENEIMVGWSKAEGLLNPDLTKDEFREIIRKQYFPKDEDMRRTGQATGDIWRFVREIMLGNYVVVPTEAGFYIGKVTGPAYYDEMRIFNDTAYRRKVEWLNNKNPIPLEKTVPEVQTRLKTLQTVIDATDLYQEIEFAMRIA
jgi:predicted Mrr-cat superfamily restriction endonuclease